MIEDASGWRGEPQREFAPTSEAELAELMAKATAERQPVTIAGALTGVTGGAIPDGGWSVSLKAFNQIGVTPGMANVGAGATLKDLQQAALATGQFFPPDPTEHWASIGGILSNNASGSRSFLFGSTRRHIEALRVCFMDGTLRTFRRGDVVDFDVPQVSIPNTTKHQSGYPLSPGMDWIDLIAGSEGTLAVIVSAELKLIPSPAELINGVVFFPDNDKALDAVAAWRSIEKLRMLEYCDADAIDLLRSRFEGIPAGAACLIIEQEGGDPDPWLDRLEESGAYDETSWFALGAADRERFRQFRHALPEVVNDIVRRNGFQKLGSDFAVPFERNREMMNYYYQALAAFPAPHVIFGHIGDAHVHVNLLPENADQVELGKALMLRFARHAVELGGTVGAEHGLGKRKRHLLELQFSAEDIQAMKDVKTKLDPHWLLAPGNLFEARG